MKQKSNLSREKDGMISRYVASNPIKVMGTQNFAGPINERWPKQVEGSDKMEPVGAMIDAS
ncbi:unnamed protein product [Dovyalis caffra]|uniref:Uncharacterized protein n=1 Tax=Dovyalis caffra TaxID=77055 RepID=A0AAV1SJH7_9ROSI|nr:unnamed protein product [Dovyalis caffra]